MINRSMFIITVHLYGIDVIRNQPCERLVSAAGWLADLAHPNTAGFWGRLAGWSSLP